MFNDVWYYFNQYGKAIAKKYDGTQIPELFMFSNGSGGINIYKESPDKKNLIVVTPIEWETLQEAQDKLFKLFKELRNAG